MKNEIVVEIEIMRLATHEMKGETQRRMHTKSFTTVFKFSLCIQDCNS